MYDVYTCQKKNKKKKKQRRGALMRRQVSRVTCKDVKTESIIRRFLLLDALFQLFQLKNIVSFKILESQFIQTTCTVGKWVILVSSECCSLFKYLCRWCFLFPTICFFFHSIYDLSVISVTHNVRLFVYLALSHSFSFLVHCLSLYFWVFPTFSLYLFSLFHSLFHG